MSEGLRCPVAEVPDSLTSVLGAAQQNSVGTLGGAKSELIKGDAFPAGSKDACTSSLSEPEGTHWILEIEGDKRRLFQDKYKICVVQIIKH